MKRFLASLLAGLLATMPAAADQTWTAAVQQTSPVTTLGSTDVLAVIHSNATHQITWANVLTVLAASFISPGSLGSGVAAALAINIGTPGSVVTNGGALGEPSSANLTNAINLPISTGLVGAGTGVLTALGIDVGTAGSVVVNGGALGTPSSGVATHLTGLPVTSLTGLGTGVLTALGISVGTPGAFVVNGGALGTPSSGTLTNATGLPISTGVSGLGANVATTLGIAASSAGGIMRQGQLLGAKPANPTGTTSTTGKMMGLGSTCTFTNFNSAHTEFHIEGIILNSSTGGAEANLRFGSTATPANGDAPSGTQPGTNIGFGVSVGSGQQVPFSITVQGATTSLTGYWFDLDLLAITTGTASVVNLYCSAKEI